MEFQIATVSPFKAGEKVSRARLLRAFFFREGQDTMKTFMDELKLCTPTDRQEMSELIAAQYGCEVDAQGAAALVRSTR